MADNLINSLIDSCQYLSDKGYGPSTSGNASAREKDRIYLTATGVALKDTCKENLACVDLGGKLLNEIKPTKETGFHLAIYHERPDIHAVIHVHPTHTVAASALLPESIEWLPSVTPTFVVRAGRVPLIPYFMPGSPKLPQAVKEKCQGSAIVLQNHGAITFAQDFKKAFHILEELEENCRIWLLVRNGGRVLSLEEIEVLIKKVNKIQ